MQNMSSLQMKGGGTFEVPGVRNGVCVILWGKDGYLDQMEGVTCGDDSLDGLALDQLVCGEYLG
ncbi:MAG: hypothetical protein DI565_05795 [Ancylobacter novellus]|uniref:Uncharacterized protein n=1 Tax=Ancylobacter novellus TaxID=921 RepID=A0A2W5KPY2_ANCNO|nr:MAG: hypothetical protein DI565_05795 [Ancylobacter novellus]